MSLGVHMLGALDPEEAVLVEAHLATCPECRAEFDELSGLTALLGRVSEEDIEQAAKPPQAVLDRLVAASAKRHRATRIMLGLAASLVAVALGGTAWLAVGRSQNATTSAAAPAASSDGPMDAAGRGVLDSQQSEALAATPAQSSLAKDVPQAAPSASALRSPAATGSPAPIPLTGRSGQVRAELVMIPGGEGTTVEISLTGVPDGTSCRLSAIGTDGTVSPAGSWTVGRGQYHGGPARFLGHTELAMDRIRAFEVRTAAGKRLLSIDYVHGG